MTHRHFQKGLESVGPGLGTQRHIHTETKLTPSHAAARTAVRVTAGAPVRRAALLSGGPQRHPLAHSDIPESVPGQWQARLRVAVGMESRFRAPDIARPRAGHPSISLGLPGPRRSWGTTERGEEGGAESGATHGTSRERAPGGPRGKARGTMVPPHPYLAGAAACNPPGDWQPQLLRTRRALPLLPPFNSRGHRKGWNHDSQVREGTQPGSAQAGSG